MTNLDHLPEPDVRWPVTVVITGEYRLWARGTDSADAARAMNRRDPIGMFEAVAAEIQIGGGAHAAVPAPWDEVYDEYEQVGPRLVDGSFWGPGARAAWTPILTQPSVTG